jgi:hypothetical protein
MITGAQSECKLEVGEKGGVMDMDMDMDMDKNLSTPRTV